MKSPTTNLNGYIACQDQRMAVVEINEKLPQASSYGELAKASVALQTAT
jgi:hypothetical protein